MVYLVRNNSSKPSEEGIELEAGFLVGGVEVSYYFTCITKLWLFSHFITFEQGSDLVVAGRIIESESFKRIRNKNLVIDDKISLDFIRNTDGLVVVDVKKSSKFEQAHYYQVLYYLWYLKNKKKVTNVKGVISYPTERKREIVELNSEKEAEIVEILKRINEIVSLAEAPKPVYKSYCKSCSYYEFCWV